VQVDGTFVTAIAPVPAGTFGIVYAPFAPVVTLGNAPPVEGVA
jgi:hypothetical protein